MKFPPRARPISLVAVSMYTYIPVESVVNLMLQLLENCGIASDIRQEFESLINICVKTNYCVFGNSVYRFDDGLPMGNPLPPLVADVYMAELEKELLTYDFSSHILLWKRYVDDVFSCPFSTLFTLPSSSLLN